MGFCGIWVVFFFLTNKIKNKKKFTKYNIFGDFKEKNFAMS